MIMIFKNQYGWFFNCKHSKNSRSCIESKKNEFSSILFEIERSLNMSNSRSLMTFLFVELLLLI